MDLCRVFCDVKKIKKLPGLDPGSSELYFKKKKKYNEDPRSFLFNIFYCLGNKYLFFARFTKLIIIKAMDKENFAKLSGVEITDAHFEKFQKLLTSYNDWNGKINISAIKDEQGIWEKHFIDSVAGYKHLKNPAKKRVLDLGTGGGFPLLPLSILVPSATFFGLDSVGKKLKVVKNIAEEASISMPNVLHGRAEDFAHEDQYREKFNVVVTRAVAAWPTLLELSLPFLKVGGEFLAYQGPAILEDLNTYKNLEQKLGAKIIEVIEEDVCGNSRVFVKMRKIKPTPKMYPREVGMPKRNPLK